MKEMTKHGSEILRRNKVKMLNCVFLLLFTSLCVYFRALSTIGDQEQLFFKTITT